MTTKKIDDHLSIELEEILGTGLLSIVYKGMYGSMPVAVKKIKYKNQTDAERDLKESKQDRERKVMHLVDKDRHQNVIGYYYSTIVGSIMYLAMQLCHGDLSKYVEDECLMAKYSPLKVNRDIAEAIAYLHMNNIAHRDLKPENVFYVKRYDTIERVVVGDFGFSKTTTQNMFSYTGSFGTMGYIPYEVWTNIKKNDNPHIRTFMTVKSDIFAMGCIFYFTVCRGRHPFGRAPHHQANIGERNPPDIHTMERAHYNLRHLLIKMLNHEPGERPTALDVSEHPALWPSGKVLHFLKDVSDDLENPNTIDRNTRQYLESADVITGDTWFQSLPRKLRKYLNEYRMSSGKYPYKERRDTVSGVLRIIRNIANHSREFPVEVREELGCYPDGHVQLWMRTCPHFFMHVYEKMTELRKPPLVTAETRSELASNMARREHTDTPVVENPDLNPDIGEDTSLISHNLELLKTDEINYVGERRSMDSEDRQIEELRKPPLVTAETRSELDHNMARREHTDTPVVVNPDLNPDIGEDTSLISHNLELLKTDEINYVGERRSMDSEDRQIEELRKPPLVTAETRSELDHNMARREHTDTPVVENPDLNPDIGEDTSLISHNLELLKTDEINYVGERRSMDSEDRQIEELRKPPLVTAETRSELDHNMARREHTDTPVVENPDLNPDIDDSNTSFVRHNLAVLEADNQRSISVASTTDPARSVSGEEQTKVVRQPTSRRHRSSDMWVQFAKQEMDEAKKTTILDQIGYNFILCVDISESMSHNRKWSQAKKFVINFISSLDSVILHGGAQIYLSLVTFGHETKVVQRLTQNFEAVKSAFVKLKLGGPTPMYGGLALGVATALIPTRCKGRPHIMLITDGRPTETTLYAGEDKNIRNTEEEAKCHILTYLGDYSGILEFLIVEVGCQDSEFIQRMASVSGGTVCSYNDGQTILNEIVSHTRKIYYEGQIMSLPAVGSRVRRGLDWSYDNQDNNGPGTIIGHGRQGLVVWVEWDADGHQNCYEYCNSTNYDVLLTDEIRNVYQEKLCVGCCVSQATEVSAISPSKNPEIGTVIKVLQGGRRVEVRWNNGKRGTYAFGEKDLFEVWPYHHETTARPEAGLQDQARSTIPPIQTAVTRPKIKNKNAFPRKPRR